VPYTAQRCSHRVSAVWPLPDVFCKQRCWQAVCAVAESGMAMSDAHAAAIMSFNITVSLSFDVKKQQRAASELGVHLLPAIAAQYAHARLDRGPCCVNAPSIRRQCCSSV
jgi:hypothetical protein